LIEVLGLWLVLLRRARGAELGVDDWVVEMSVGLCFRCAQMGEGKSRIGDIGVKGLVGGERQKGEED
jgi:hypothetical protein